MSEVATNILVFNVLKWKVRVLLDSTHDVFRLPTNVWIHSNHLVDVLDFSGTGIVHMVAVAFVAAPIRPITNFFVTL